MALVQQRRRMATIARHLTDSSSLHSLAYENSRKPGKNVPVVIGGMVIDIQATPTGGCLIRGSTTPGQVRYVRGGVARNVAESMAILGTRPFLISVVGDDDAGDSMVSHWKSLGLSVDGIRRCEGATTPVVSAVFDKQGELAAAIADTVAIEEHLTSEWISQFAEVIKGASIVMLDANLQPPALESACVLAVEAKVPIWFEPVSVAKSVRAAKMLHLMTYTSPNEAELVSMAQSLHQNDVKEKDSLSVKDPPDSNLSEPAASLWRMRHSIQTLLSTGLKHIILTMGAHGAVLCSFKSSSSSLTPKAEQKSTSYQLQQSPSRINHKSTHRIPDSGATRKEALGVTYIQFPALPASVSNLSGAGDCLVAGALVALSSSSDIESAVAHGVSASKWAVESDSNVFQNLSENLVSDGAKEVSTSARQILL